MNNVKNDSWKKEEEEEEAWWTISFNSGMKFDNW